MCWDETVSSSRRCLCPGESSSESPGITAKTKGLNAVLTLTTAKQKTSHMRRNNQRLRVNSCHWEVASWDLSTDTGAWVPFPWSCPGPLLSGAAQSLLTSQKRIQNVRAGDKEAKNPAGAKKSQVDLLALLHMFVWSQDVGHLLQSTAQPRETPVLLTQLSTDPNPDPTAPRSPAERLLPGPWKRPHSYQCPTHSCAEHPAIRTQTPGPGSHLILPMCKLLPHPLTLGRPP